MSSHMIISLQVRVTLDESSDFEVTDGNPDEDPFQSQQIQKYINVSIACLLLSLTSKFRNTFSVVML